MIEILFSTFASLSGFRLRVNSMSDLAVENLALRQQLEVLKRTNKRPRLRQEDRIFWVLLSMLWGKWRDALVIVKPETVIHWHKRAFKSYWKQKSRRKGPGRSPVSRGVRELVRRMAEANPMWGAPRIHGELLKLGISISERTVSSLMPPRPVKPPSQTWKTFLKNHWKDAVSVDFFTVPTAAFRVLFVFVVLGNDKRRVIHFNATYHPTAKWTARQIANALGGGNLPKYLMRDRDSIYGAFFQRQVEDMGITEVKSAPRSPWQDPFVERLIGSIRKECLDHMIVLNRRHLRGILSSYFDYYNRDRTHYNLEKDSPYGRQVQCRGPGWKLVSSPRVGGLHHRYSWRNSA